MKFLFRNISPLLFLAGLMLFSSSLWAQQTKQPGLPPAPRTEEIREAVQPAFDQPQQETPQEVAIRQQKEAEEAKLVIEQEAAALRERELESKKVINPNWRNQKSQEQLIMEAKRAEVEAINKADREARLAEIQKIETMLTQVSGQAIPVQQPVETEQARMSRTLSAAEYDNWKQAQSQNIQQETKPATGATNKGARVLPAPTKNMQKQNLGGVQIITHQNGKSTALRENGTPKEMSVAKKAIYQQYGLQPDISKEEMIQWRQNNPDKWKMMRQDLRNSITNSNKK